MVVNKFPRWMPIPGRNHFNKMLAQVDEFLYGMIAQLSTQESPAISID